MNAEIRTAQPEDAEGLANVWIDAGEYYAELNPELFQVPQSDGLSEFLGKNLGRVREDVAVFVAELEGEVVGWVQGGLLPPRDDAHWQLLREVAKARLEIQVLAVHRSFQRRGIGRDLVRTLEEWALERGAELLNVDTYIDSPLSVPFYEDGVNYVRRSLRFWKRLT